tara:strand:+ start:903 stop:1463 length:561 start_codon:yes stop_codon:yes gene_type:complete
MPNYKDGKIYKIVDNTNGNIYVGSTTQKYLSRRLDGHRNHYKQFLKGKGRECKSFNIIKNHDYKIILICNYPCDNIEELHKIEQKYIDEYDCINQQRAYLSKEQRKKDMKQYRNDNIDKMKKNDKDRYELNKDKMKKQALELYHKKQDYRKKQMNELRKYKNSWGGNIDHRCFNCNLLFIDPFLFQ